MLTSADARALAGLLALTAAVLGDLVVTSARVVSHPFGDTARFFLPYRSFGYRELAAGNLPLWNPHLFSGTPFVGGFQSAMFYPPNLIHLILPTATAVNAEVAISSFLLGAFMYAWARGRGLRPVAAFFAATVLMYSGAYALRVFAGQLTVLATLAWTPLLFLAIDRILERPSLGWSLVGVLATTMQMLAGYPAFALMTAVTAALYVALHMPRAPNPLWSAASLLVVATAPVLLGAVQLWPGLETATESVRAGGGSYNLVSQFSFPPENLLTLVAPAFFGDLLRLPYWGRAFFWDASLFVGTVGLSLVALGALRGPRDQRRYLLGLALLFVVIALGQHAPLHRFLYTWVPGISQIRAPSKFLFFATLFLAMLSGVGANCVLEGARGSGGVVVAFLTLALVLSSAAVVLGWVVDPIVHPLPGLLGLHETDPEQFFRLDEILYGEAATLATRSLLVAAATCLGAALLLWTGQRSRWAGLTLIGLGVVEMVLLGRLYRGSFDVSVGARPGVDAVYGSASPEVRVFDLGGSLNSPGRNRCMHLGGYAIWGYDPVLLKRYAEFIGATQPEQVPPWLRATLFPPRKYHPLFGMFRCGTVVTPHDPRAVPPLGGRRPLASEQLRPAGGQDKIVRVDGALPRFVFVANYRVERDPNATLAVILDKTFDPRRTVILEEEPLVRAAEGEVRGQVALLDESTDDLNLDISLDRDAILVMTDSYSQGWRVIALSKDPLQDYRIVPANYALRALALRAGRHTIRVEYAPLSFRIGSWVSLASAALYAGAVIWWVVARQPSDALRARAVRVLSPS